MKRMFLITAITVGVLISSDLSAKETMTWQVIHWPPFQMLEGADKGQGRYDALLALFIANLPQYEHRTVEMNWARFWNEIKEGKNICNMFAIKTEERSTYAVFSKPLSMGLPLRIIMRKSSIETLGNRQPISIVDLLKDKRFKGVFVAQRSYYPVIDQILEQYGSLPTIKRIAISDENAIRMILSGRMDYTLEYPYVANYMVGKIKPSYDTEIGSIAVKELLDYGKSSLACPDNAWGEKVVEDFDEMLNRLKHKPEYLKIMQMYHSEQRELDDVRNGFKAIILEAE